VDVRCYNPPRLDSPLGWLSRDHRKMLSVDGAVSFITGPCAGRMWEGIPEKNIASWLGNCELDAVIEDEPFAREVEAMYLEDPMNATEAVLDGKRRSCAPGEPVPDC
jgi:phosphatidylserine/phosphatidylglycerophosphate/cardiolipin synthase-like enzyme